MNPRTFTFRIRDAVQHTNARIYCEQCRLNTPRISWSARRNEDADIYAAMPDTFAFGEGDRYAQFAENADGAVVVICGICVRIADEFDLLGRTLNP